MPTINVQIESLAGTLADDEVRLSTQDTFTQVNGRITSDVGLSGYWLILVWDRSADGRLTAADMPWWFRAVWVPIGLGTLPPWLEGSDPVNLLAPPGFDALTLSTAAGRRKLIIPVAVGYEQIYRSAGVTWPIPSLTGGPLRGGVGDSPIVDNPNNPTLGIELGQLIGLAADGLATKALADYEVVRLRINRIDPPTR